MRSSGPHRRSPVREQAGEPGFRPGDAVWELWNIRALWPDADLEFLARLKRDQDRHLAREREALAGLWSGDREILSPGHAFLAGHPELASGIILSLHIGPYQLLAEPWLAAGHEPVILLNRNALPSFRKPVQQFLHRLGLKDRITWIAVGEEGFARQLIRAVREGRPVLVYLDGNGGQKGMAETRERGLGYALPGREIRVRTGLARLLCRLGCPVHRVVTHWNEDQQLVWRREPTLHWSRGDEPDDVTRFLYDWAFAEIMTRPAQWQYWAMLRESSSCFGHGALEQGTVPRELRQDFQRSFHICLERAPAKVKLVLEHRAEVWPGEVLADLTADRFYPAAGLQDADLEFLRQEPATLKELCGRHGRAWVEFHGLRLCLLGLARLGG